MLEELGLRYEVRPIDIGRDQQFGPEFLRISPNNKIPALVDEEADGGTLAVFESGTILTLSGREDRALFGAGRSGAVRRDGMAALEHRRARAHGRPARLLLAAVAGQSAARHRSIHPGSGSPAGRDGPAIERVRLPRGKRLLDRDMAAYTWTFFVSTRLDHVLADSLASKPAIYRWLEVVGDRPAVRRGMLVPEVGDVASFETIASFKHRIKVAEEERDALRVSGQEELYMQACSMVEALELQLEERPRQAVTGALLS